MMSKKNNLLSNSEISAFCAQMALILKSGISPSEGISILGAESGGDSQKIFSDLSASLELGDSLGQSMKKSGVFPTYACDMTEIGVLSGRTDEVMEALAAHYEREEETASAIRSAVTYPAVMIGMLFAVILVLITRVLPIFNQVFKQLGSELTGLSRALMNIGNVISRYSIIFILLLIFLVAVIYFLCATNRGLTMRQHLFSKIPPIRKLQEQLSAGRFADGLSIALSSGLPLEDSIQMAARLADDPVTREKIQKCREAYQSGSTFSEAVLSAQLFSGIYARMLAVGYMTGSTETVLRKIADQYASETDERISHMITILEPTLVAILSCIVGLILLSVMLPLLGIMSSVGLY